jgi:hypothetical protein
VYDQTLPRPHQMPGPSTLMSVHPEVQGLEYCKAPDPVCRLLSIETLSDNQDQHPATTFDGAHPANRQVRGLAGYWPSGTREAGVWTPDNPCCFPPIIVDPHKEKESGEASPSTFQEAPLGLDELHGGSSGVFPTNSAKRSMPKSGHRMNLQGPRLRTGAAPFQRLSQLTNVQRDLPTCQDAARTRTAAHSVRSTLI